MTCNEGNEDKYGQDSKTSGRWRDAILSYHKFILSSVRASSSLSLQGLANHTVVKLPAPSIHSNTTAASEK